tara:strand:- start:6035 stop:6307 length:273 start_codon:yes stop_codon:yes gene_type:complete
MALEKQIKDDYEVRTEHKHINVRTKTSIIEDGKELSYSYHRKVLTPDMDVSGESAEIKALAGAIWTDAVKKAWSDKLEADKKALENKVGE